MAIQKLHNHPELIMRTDALLCSINERLAGQPGMDFEPLTMDFMLDAVDLHLQEAKMLEDSKEEEQDMYRQQNQEVNWKEFKL